MKNKKYLLLLLLIIPMIILIGRSFALPINSEVKSLDISGDNYKTVCSIAKRAGLEDVQGMDATLLNETNIDESLEKYEVFGRVTPDQKKMIIEQSD